MKYRPRVVKMESNFASKGNILIHPDGSIDEGTLVNLLAEATERRLVDSQRIQVIRERRAREYTPEEPAYANEFISRRVSDLRTWFKEWIGRDYVPGNHINRQHAGIFYAEPPLLV